MTCLISKDGKPIAQFVHIPKTGGTFVRHVLEELGFELELLGMGHSGISVTDPGIFTFTFIRDPLTWYPSMFSYRSQHGWPKYDSFRWEVPQCSTLMEFLNSVRVIHGRNYLYGIYKRGCIRKRTRTTADFIGCYENLMSDLKLVLGTFVDQTEQGLEFINDLPRINSSGPIQVGRSHKSVIRRLEPLITSRTPMTIIRRLKNLE